MNKYPCIKCGLCCKRIDKVVESLNGEIDFPYKWDSTGRCEKLDDNNLCMVYDDRPFICNVDRVLDTADLEQKEFYNINIASCNRLLYEAGREEKIDFIP